MQFLFGISGRIGRARWWLVQALTLLLPGGCFLLALFSLDPNRSVLEGPVQFLWQADPTLLALSAIPAAPAIWINLAATVKRYHDRNKPGYWAFVPMVPYLGAFWQLVECGFLPGTPGSNDYGGRGGRRPLPLDDLDIAALSVSARLVP